MVDAETLRSMIDQTRRLVREELIREEWVRGARRDSRDHVVDLAERVRYFGLTIPEEYGRARPARCVEEVSVVREVGHASPKRSYFQVRATASARSSIIIDGTEEQRRKLPAAHRVAGEPWPSFCPTEPGVPDAAIIPTTRATRATATHTSSTARASPPTRRTPESSRFRAHTGERPEDGAGISAFRRSRHARHHNRPRQQEDGIRRAHGRASKAAARRRPLLGGREGRLQDRDNRSIMCACNTSAAATARVVKRITRRGRALPQRACVRAADRAVPAHPGCRLRGRGARVAHDRASPACATKGVRSPGRETACRKYFTTEALGRIADRVMQIHGAYIKEYPIERLFRRDARLLRIYEGTSQIQH